MTSFGIICKQYIFFSKSIFRNYILGSHHPFSIYCILIYFATYFKNFQWQSDENHLQDRSLHWDHALLLTGLDLESKTTDGKVSNKIVGLAPVSGMCDPKTSCTVSEGNHFESVFVIAHEFGHNLGMKHDGRTGKNSN